MPAKMLATMLAASHVGFSKPPAFHIPGGSLLIGRPVAPPAPQGPKSAISCQGVDCEPSCL
eukprot:3402091-Prorocentrum_lima.AAC.1